MKRPVNTLINVMLKILNSATAFSRATLSVKKGLRCGRAGAAGGFVVARKQREIHLGVIGFLSRPAPVRSTDDASGTQRKRPTISRVRVFLQLDILMYLPNPTQLILKKIYNLIH